MWRKLFERSTGDILVLLVAFTVCASVAGAGIALILVFFLNPDANLAAAWGLVTDSINTLIGLLAGFIAGRTEGGRSENQVQSPTRDPDNPSPFGT